MKPLARWGVALGLSAMLVAACGSTDGASDSATGTSASTTASSAAGQEDTDGSPSSGPVVEVTISGDEVSPTNETIDATVGQTVTITVDSDATDELHVHSVPDHTFEVAAADGQSFEFVPEVPGQVDIELHHLDKTIATVVVGP